MKLQRLLGAIGAVLMFAVSCAGATEQGTFVMPVTGPMNMAIYSAGLNSALRAIASCHWGPSQPLNGPGSAAIVYQCWADTTSNPVPVKRFDGTQWSIEGALDTSAHTWTPYRQGAPIVTVATSGSATDLTAGTLPAARLPNPTASTLGGVQSKTCLSSNWLNQISTSGVPGCSQPSFADLVGSIACSQLPALTGDVTRPSGSCVSTLANIPSGTPAAGSLLAINIAAPSTPASGKTQVFVDSTDKRLHDKNDAGTIGTTVVADTGAANSFLTAISTAGVISKARPACANLSDASVFCSGTSVTLLTGLGTGVASALGVNTGSAGAFVVNGGALGTPSSGTLTNATGLPISTGVSGLATGIASWLATPSSANLAAALTDETGSGAAVFGTAPTISAPTLSGLVNISGAVKFSTQSAPAQITSNQNDYNPGSVVCASSATLLINSDAARDVTGLAGGAAGCEMRLVNNGSFTITLKEQNASSTAANRFNTGGDIALASNAALTLLYDGAASRWRMASPSSTGGGSGTVTQVVCNGLTITTSGTCPEPFGFENCSLAALQNGTILTVALKDNAGSDPTASSPCRIVFRNAAAGTGSWSIDSVTSALSINTNAAGATLGTSNATAFRFWVEAFDNGGAVVLALFNASTATQCFALDETQVQSTTPISASATSASTFYTPNGTTLTGKAFKILGYIEYNATGLVTAGTYATSPNFIQSFGPGVRKPCETVQSYYQNTTALQASSGATFPTVTGFSKTFTLTSAANLVRTNGKTVMQTGSGGSATTGVYRSTGSFTCTTVVGTPATIGTTIQGGGTFMSIDKPNALNPIYGYCWGVTGTGGTASNADLTLDEIMG